MIEKFITPAQLAALLGLKESTLANWRSMKSGPCFIKADGVILYAESDVNEWLVRHRVVTTQARTGFPPMPPLPPRRKKRCDAKY